jgi:hypothetical protein
MADGDFDAIYGDAKPTSEAATVATNAAINDALDADNDDELFQQLYGDVPPEEIRTTPARPTVTDVVLNRRSILLLLCKLTDLCSINNRNGVIKIIFHLYCSSKYFCSFG